MKTIFFFFLAFLAEVAGTIGGFGSSVFFVPLAGLFMNFQVVLALTGILHVFSNISKLVMFRKHINIKLSLLLGIPSVLFVIVGAYLSTVFYFEYTEIILGSFLIVFALLMFLYPKLKLPQKNSTLIASGGVAGFLAGLIGTGGAIRGLGMAAFQLEKNCFVATSAMVDLGVDLSRTVVYLSNKFLEPTYYWYIPILFIVALAGSYIGKKILNKIPQETFKRIVLIFLGGIGVILIVKIL